MARKPSAQPYLNNDVLTQREQAKHLGVKEETTMNLGHPVPVSRLTDNPLGKPVNYDTAPQAERQIKEGQRLTQGVYGRHVPINDGRSTAENLQAWSKYSTSNSYHGRDPRGRGAGSDNHLQSTKGWPRFDAGSDSGEGRLEKTRK
jgi:hypothetical protein